MSALMIYIDKINTNEDGIEEPVGEQEGKVLDIGESANITVHDGEVIYIQEPAMFGFKKISDIKAVENKPETKPDNKNSEIPEEDRQKEIENSIGWEEFLDEYEDWVDEYIAFMKKYTDNPMDLSLVADYGKLMAEYSDWASKTADFSDDLSDADALKYIDRLNKINIKLASAGL